MHYRYSVKCAMNISVALIVRRRAYLLQYYRHGLSISKTLFDEVRNAGDCRA